jgi:hypothetical protein
MYLVNHPSELWVRSYPDGLKLCSFDALRISEVSKRTGVAFTYGVLQLSDHIFRIYIPLLVNHCSSSTVCRISDTQKFGGSFGSAGSRYCSLLNGSIAGCL